MKRAILNLEELSDKVLFETLSEGMPLIADNAVSHDETARRLYGIGELRASGIMRGFAEEEAAKVLILLDYVRCPKSSKQRRQVLKRFYGHVAKRIHAMACRYPNIASFAELSGMVERECLPWHLDGPNYADWIFPNSISQERERDLYVDYLRDVSDAKGECFWTVPFTPIQMPWGYRASECVMLVRSLSSAGALKSSGLAEIADFWRRFEPVPDTDRGELHDLIEATLKRLEPLHCGAVDETAERFIIKHWPFPLWPLSMRQPDPDNASLNHLREERRRTIARIEETEAKRDPPPAVSRAMVEDMSNAYAAWERDVEESAVRNGGSAGGEPRIRSHADRTSDLELASYAKLSDKLVSLSDEERVALVALGWFARGQIADWARAHEQAIDMTPSLCEVYQIGLGRHWLPGLDRWESIPAPFSPGQSYQY